MSTPSTPARPDIAAARTAAALVRCVAEIALAAAHAAIRARRRFTLATALDPLQRRALVRLEAAGLDRHAAHLFVAEGGPGSPLARPFGPGTVHVPPPATDPNRAANAYEQQVRGFFGLAPGELPVFDLVLLSLHGDGRVAGFSPYSTGADETGRVAVASYARATGTRSITLTAPVINNARETLVLAAGPDAGNALGAALAAPRDPQRFPLHLLAPAHGALRIFIDAVAALRIRDLAPHVPFACRPLEGRPEPCL